MPGIKMLRDTTLFVVLACYFCLGVSLCSAELPPDETMSIRFSTWHLHDSLEVQTVWIPMLEELSEQSKGRISYALLDSAVLGSGPDHYDIVAKGISDMGYATLTWLPGRFPLTDVLSLPADIRSKETATDIGNAMLERILSPEFLGIKVLDLNGCIASCLWTRRPVHTRADLAGLRIRSPGGMQTRCIESLGAQAVFMPMSQVYSALENGSIDGVVTCPSMYLSFGLYRAASYGTLATFGCVDEGLFMNLDSWNGTPDDLKAIITRVCSNPYRATGAMSEQSYARMMREIEDRGVELYDLPPEEAERWYSGFQNMTRTWAEELEAVGLPAKKAVVIFNQECEKRGARCAAFPPEWR
jgi:TRAP-type C4-dicarboxylate transport system substrate-binding protein